MTPNRHNQTIRIGISTCLLGKKVRFDGGHKHDRYITDILGEYFGFVPICPEIDVGMGVPREAVQLAGDSSRPHLIGTKSGADWTARMNEYSEEKARQLPRHHLSGFIFKSKSPTCGMARVKLYTTSGQATSIRTTGLFARRIMDRFPLLPVEEEGRLNDARLRENFIVRVFAYHRLQQLFSGKFSRAEAIRFHTRHKYLMLAHSPRHYKQLGQLVAAIKQITPAEFQQQYSALFMEGLRFKSTAAKNTNVLQHIVGFLKNHLDDHDKPYLLNIIEDYRRELVPLVVPVTLVKHYVQKFGVEYLQNQVYLDPHPKELMLRNHV